MSRNALFCSLATFSIVSPTPFINKPVSSRDLIIFMISFISSFEIVSVVMSGLKIFFWIPVSVADVAPLDSDCISPSRPVHFRKLYWNKNQLKFFFSHFFVVLQKGLHKTLGTKGTKNKCENKNLGYFFIFVRDWGAKG